MHQTLILWINSFLRDRPQHVLVNGKKSENVVLNTGLPQGCVLSPILFSIYINEMTCDNDNLTLIKYADDMALVGRVKDIQSLDTYNLDRGEFFCSLISAKPKKCVVELTVYKHFVNLC